MIDCDNLDKNKYYCAKCFDSGIIKELFIDENDNEKLKIPDCGHYGSSFYKIVFIDNKWRRSNGILINSKLHKKINVFNHVCSNCNFQFKSKGAIYTCPKCGFNNKGLIHHKCSKCNFEEDTKGANWICPKCHDNSSLNRYNHICNICEYKEVNTIPYNVWTCPKCNSYELTEINCPECNNIIKYRGTTYKCNNCGYTNRNLIHHKCYKCNFEEDTKGSSWICPNCGNRDNVTKFNHQCKNPECMFEEINEQPINVWSCPECGWKPDYNIHDIFHIWELGLGGFNREEFYKEKLNLISFDSINQEATLEDFDSLKGELGVWSRWTDENHENYCLDVCKTVDIGGEMLSSLRSFNSLQENPDQELDIGWKKKYMNQAKDADIFNGGKLIFKLVAFANSDEEALAIETQYAHDNKAKYWSPQPGQKIKNY